jgi:hypothetical protein
LLPVLLLPTVTAGSLDETPDESLEETHHPQRLPARYGASQEKPKVEKSA